MQRFWAAVVTAGPAATPPEGDQAAVHAFDAQQAAGRADPLPHQVAADGIGEYLTVGMASMGARPYQSGRIGLAAAEGITWLIDLDGSAALARARPAGRAPGGQDAAAEPGARIRDTSSDLVLTLYGRQPHHGVTIEGDEELAALLLSWTFND